MPRSKSKTRAKRPSRRSHQPTQSVVFGEIDGDDDSVASAKSHGSNRSYGSNKSFGSTQQRSVGTIHSNISYHPYKSNPPKQPHEAIFEVQEKAKKPTSKLFTRVMPITFVLLISLAVCFPTHVARLEEGARSLVQSPQQKKSIEAEFKITKPAVRKVSKKTGASTVVQSKSADTSSSVASSSIFSSIFPQEKLAEAQQEQNSEQHGSEGGDDGDKNDELEEHRFLRERIEILEEQLRQQLASGKNTGTDGSMDKKDDLRATITAEEGKEPRNLANPSSELQQEDGEISGESALRKLFAKAAAEQKLLQAQEAKTLSTYSDQQTVLETPRVLPRADGANNFAQGSTERKPLSTQGMNGLNVNQEALVSNPSASMYGLPQQMTYNTQQEADSYGRETTRHLVYAPEKTMSGSQSSSSGYHQGEQQPQNILVRQALEAKQDTLARGNQVGPIYQGPRVIQPQSYQLANPENTQSAYTHYDSINNNNEMKRTAQSYEGVTYQRGSGSHRRLTSENINTSANLRHRKLQEAFSDQVNVARYESAPSHVRICEAVAKNLEVTITEGDLCTEPNHFSYAMAEIFLSGYLSSIAQANGFHVEYQHNCGRFQADLFQTMIPTPLRKPDSSENEFDGRDLIGFCNLVFHRYVVKKLSNPLEILLWDTRNAGDPSKPHDPNNPPVVHPGWRGRYFNSKSDVFGSSKRKELLERTAQEKATYPQTPMLELLIPIIQENIRAGLIKARHAQGLWLDAQLNDAPIVESVAIGKTTIFLPCRDIQGSDAIAIPLYSYVAHVPKSTDILDVVVNKQCYDTSPALREYVSLLIVSLQQFNPRRAVNLVASAPSSPDTVLRVTEDEFVICGPGTGMMCLFPALSRTRGRFILMNVGFDQVDGYSATTYASILAPALIQHIQPPSMNFPAAFLSEFGEDSMKMMSFAASQPRREEGECRSLRGRVGMWVQDMEYAATAQYKHPLNESYSGITDAYFQEQVKEGKTDLKYRTPTTYRWSEILYRTCPITPISPPGVCQVLKDLDVRRIFLLGDSLSAQTSESMWMLLTEGKYAYPDGFRDHFFKTSISCTDFDYTLQFVRNDTLAESVPIKGYKEKSKNWIEPYMEDDARTLLLVNTGPHIKNLDIFREAIDNFFVTMDNMNRPDDIILMRTSVPGHWNCSRKGIKPFDSYAEYEQDQLENADQLLVAAYGWDEFEYYNRYMARAIDDFNLGSPSKKRPLAELLDVFPMTVQRPDGHCSDEFRPELIGTNDCLHYALPGPVDWWSHLVYNHLEDIAVAERLHKNVAQ